MGVLGHRLNGDRRHRARRADRMPRRPGARPGPQVRAGLSWADVDEIVRRFEALNPYDREIVPGSVLEIEPRTTARTGSAGSSTATRSRPNGTRSTTSTSTDSPPSDASPTATRTTSRQTAISPPTRSRKCAAPSTGSGICSTPPTPSQSPATGSASFAAHHPYRRARVPIGRTRLARPAGAHPNHDHQPAAAQPFEAHDAKRPVAERIRPYNFGLVAHVHEPGLQGLPDRFLLVAPYESDPRKWRRLRWTNAYDPDGWCEIVAHDGTGEQLASSTRDQVIVKTYRTVLDNYRTHPEVKSLGSDGKPCNRATIGLLSRRPVKAAAIHSIGKESNKIEEALSGLVTDLDDVLTEYRGPEQDPFKYLVVPVIRELAVAEVAAGADVSIVLSDQPRRPVHRQDRARQAQRLRDPARPRPAPRSRRLAAPRPRGATRRIRRRQRPGPRAPAMRMRMRATDQARTARPGGEVAFRRLPQAGRSPARRPRLNPHAHERPHPARPLAGSDCSFSIDPAPRPVRESTSG